MSDHLIAEANRHAKALPVNPDRLAIALALQTIDELERENAALRDDKERLDWLEKARPIAWALGNSTCGEYWLLTDLGEGHPEEAEEFPTLREAIDAARREGTP
jgi:hypothetical protein